MTIFFMNANTTSRTKFTITFLLSFQKKLFCFKHSHGGQFLDVFRDLGSGWSRYFWKLIGINIFWWNMLPSMSSPKVIPAWSLFHKRWSCNIRKRSIKLLCFLVWLWEVAGCYSIPDPISLKNILRLMSDILHFYIYLTSSTCRNFRWRKCVPFFAWNRFTNCRILQITFPSTSLLQLMNLTT